MKEVFVDCCNDCPLHIWDDIWGWSCELPDGPENIDDAMIIDPVCPIKDEPIVIRVEPRLGG